MEHGARFSPLYGGYLSDHGTMAALALQGIGADSDRVLAYLLAYEQRLNPLSAAPPGYQHDREEALRDIAQFGVNTVLARSLPSLISGWARDAYHPLIRIAYGYEFGIDEEVAAGLAYLRCCGPDETIAQLARNPTPAAHAINAFKAMSHCASAVTPARNFNACLTGIVSNPKFCAAAVVVPDQLLEFSRQTLRIFEATHNFFALHLVTGAHAFRTLDPFTGADREAVFAIGLLAGYAALGAPDIADADLTDPDFSDLDAAASGEDWLARVSDDEHDIKLAFSACSQADFFADNAYLRVAAGYLNR